MSDMPDYAAKMIRDLPDWRAVLGQDLDEFGMAFCAPSFGYTLIDYTLGVGEYLLIYDWSVVMADGKGNVYGEIYNVTRAVTIALCGGVQGFQGTFSKPKVVPELERVRVRGAHWEAVDHWLSAYLGGIILSI